MNSHRSAISAYHAPIDGMQVGKHPLVTSLLKGAGNLRPALPRYRYIWNVELVLQKMRTMPHNNSLTLEQLSAKVVTLLGLCVIKRSGEIAAMTVKWTSIFTDKIICAFGIRAKTSKDGKVAKPMVFHRFESDEKICPVSCLKAYIDRTKIHREAHGTLMVFLSWKKPHKPVKRSTITKWVLKMFSWAGIDTNLFKAHSMRAAASSGVSKLGLKLKDILDNGNWSNESTWQKFYHVRIAYPSERFQKTLLTGNTTSFEGGSAELDPVSLETGSSMA